MENHQRRKRESRQRRVEQNAHMRLFQSNSVLFSSDYRPSSPSHDRKRASLTNQKHSVCDSTLQCNANLNAPDAAHHFQLPSVPRNQLQIRTMEKQTCVVHYTLRHSYNLDPGRQPLG